MHKVYDCSLIPEEQESILAQAQSLNTRGPQKREAIQFGAPRQQTLVRHDTKNDQQHNSRHQHQNTQYHRNDGLGQENWLGKEDRWNFSIPYPSERSKKDFHELPSLGNSYF